MPRERAAQKRCRPLGIRLRGVDLPEQCFCGCGRPVRPTDAANLEGFMLGIELGRWINWLTIMNAASEENDTARAEGFMEDGAVVYRLLVDEVHDGVQVGRRDRKQRKRWMKFSEKSRKKVSAVIPPDEPNPFEARMPTAQQVRAWVYDGTLIPLDA